MKNRAIKQDSRLIALFHQLSHVPQTLKLMWVAARPWPLIWFSLLLIQGLLPAAVIYLVRAVVNQIAAAMHTGGSLMQPGLLVPGAFLLIAILLFQFISAIARYVRGIQSELIRDHVQLLIQQKALSLELAYYETPGYYDQLHQSRYDALIRPQLVLENIGSAAQGLVTLSALAVILFTYVWWLPLVLVLSASPAFFIMTRPILRFHAWRRSNTVNERRSNYYDNLLTMDTSAAELRLFDLGSYFSAIFAQIRKNLRTGRFVLSRSQLIAEISGGVISLLTVSVVMVWMCMQALSGLATLGDVVLFYQLLSQAQRISTNLLSSGVEVYNNALFLENLWSFLNLSAKNGAPLPDVDKAPLLKSEVRLENVHFTYPGSTRLALKGLNLTIPAGRIVAVVGKNGAGKSSLVKLLCRLYDPDAGRILFDGADARCFHPRDFRKIISVVFQTPMHYFESIGSNIRFGDLDVQPEDLRLGSAAEAAEFDEVLKRMPEGFRTQLGKQFGGTEMSAGEWQRLALARAFYRQSALLVLDEPTSAMDSWAEADWMSRFRKAAADRTVLIITHRFTTAIHADLIYVMDQGQVVESGSHEALVKLNGAYAEAWFKQTRPAYG